MKKERLTASQMRYLFTIYRLQASGANVTQVALELGVSKPSSHKMIGTLAAMGFVTKADDGEISLTESGKEQAEELDTQHNLLTQFLLASLDLDPETAKEDAHTLLSEMSDQFLTLFFQQIAEKGEILGNQMTEKETGTDFSDLLEDGLYTLPFRLLRKDGEKASMGNKGFLHPCRLRIDHHKGEILLQAKALYYRSVIGRHLHGKLSKLSYWNGAEYVPISAREDTYAIPIHAMEAEYDAGGRLLSGTVMIKARASVGIFNMPESAALLRLNFGVIKKTEEWDDEGEDALLG